LAGLRPNPLGKLTALPQIPSWIQRGGAGWKGGERRDRPVHFLVASAAYPHKGTHAQKDRQAENIVPQSHP